MNLSKQAFGPDDPKIEVAKQMAMVCGSKITNTERCEAAAQMYECTKEESEKNGYDFMEFI